jgi:hypothetical protein
MKIKTTFAALLLTALPGLTFAMGCGFEQHAPEQTTGICAVGQTWDATTASCVDAVTS